MICVFSTRKILSFHFLAIQGGDAVHPILDNDMDNTTRKEIDSDARTTGVLEAVIPDQFFQGARRRAVHSSITPPALADLTHICRIVVCFPGMERRTPGSAVGIVTVRAAPGEEVQVRGALGTGLLGEMKYCSLSIR